jgi:hypothetical protein
MCSDSATIPNEPPIGYQVLYSPLPGGQHPWAVWAAHGVIARRPTHEQGLDAAWRDYRQQNPA